MLSHEQIKAEDVVRELEETMEGTAEGVTAGLNNPYIGIASGPFPEESIRVLLQEIPEEEVEIRPDGLIYLPEIKYRRILNRAFGPGAWSILPKDITISTEDSMLYYKGALFVNSRFVSESIGEQPYTADRDRMSFATAAESAKSNCLMRCCKDLGIASELWDPTYVRNWVRRNAVEVWCTNVGNNPLEKGRKRKMWRKNSAGPIDNYPWKEELDRDVPLMRGVAPGANAGGPSTAEASGPVSLGPASGPVITFRQVRRFQAIARDRGWAREETQRLLASYGYARPEEITRFEYHKICAALESPTIHAELRDDLDHEDASHGGDEVQELPF